MSSKRLWWGDEAAARILRDWHANLGTDAAARAALRRVRETDDAWEVPAYARLVRELRGAGYEVEPWRARTMTAEAVAVAEVGRDERSSEPERWGLDLVAERFVKAWKGAAISGPRLRVLLGTETPDMFSRLLRGAIGMVRAAEIGIAVVAVAEIARRHHRADRRVEMRRAVLFTAATEGLFDKEDST